MCWEMFEDEIDSVAQVSLAVKTMTAYEQANEMA